MTTKNETSTTSTSEIMFKVLGAAFVAASATALDLAVKGLISKKVKSD